MQLLTLCSGGRVLLVTTGAVMLSVFFVLDLCGAGALAVAAVRLSWLLVLLLVRGTADGG